MKNIPMISILTPSYNQGKFIEETIQSVLNQNYPNFEHIVIDGGSTDNTIDILKKYPHLIWISEKDNGLADALNKALALAKGEIIGWINSDDFYTKNSFINVVKEFDEPNVQWIIGNLIYYNDKTRKIRRNKNIIDITYNELIKNADIVKQPSTFYRKSIIDKVNGLNSKFYMVMDYDLFIRLSKISTPKMVNKYLAYFRLHENQLTSPKNAHRNSLIQMKEINIILKRENIGFLRRKIILKNKYIPFYKFIIKKFLSLNTD